MPPTLGLPELCLSLAWVPKTAHIVTRAAGDGTWQRMIVFTPTCSTKHFKRFDAHISTYSDIEKILKPLTTLCLRQTNTVPHLVTCCVRE